MTEPTRNSNFVEDLPALLDEIDKILRDGDNHSRIDDVLNRLKNYNGLDNAQQDIVQNFKDALMLRDLLQPDEYLSESDIVRGSVLGGGGFSQVYKGSWKKKQVAVKKLHPILPPATDERSKLVASFHQELVQLKMVSKLHFVWPILGFTMWLDRDEMAIVLALVSPLAEGYLKLTYMDWQSLKPKKFANYFHDAATGLQSLHAHGVIHGDIRPENILQNEGRCYLVDFCISKFLDSSSSFSSAPAVAKSQRILKLDVLVTQRNQYTDVVSFGSTMYQVLARETLKIATGQPDRPESRLGREWDAIWNLILRCVSEKYQDHRPTAVELVESLKAI